MAKKKFLLQGFTAHTHHVALNSLLDVPDAHRVILGAAFVSEGGTRLIEKKLKPHAPHLSIFAGIRNEITSIQGLARLHAVGGKLYTVDTGSWKKLFHPKLYYVRHAMRARALIGSANLTLGGLNNNIEASILVDFDLGDDADLDAANAFEALFDALPANHPKNVVPVTALTDLDALRAAGLIADEDLVNPPQIHPPKGAGSPSATTPPIELRTTPMFGHKAKPKAQAKVKPAGKKKPAGLHSYAYVWQSKKLRPININIFTSATAAKKNVLSLGQGGYPVPIDFQNYFRQSVFGALIWAPSQPAGVEEAWADFEFVLGGVNYGVFHLRVRYSKSTATVNQNNVTTRLVWGDLLPIVSNAANLNRVVYLFRDVDDPTRFMLEID